MPYSDSDLIETIYQKTINYSGVRYWPEMNGAKSVLDFGGGFGVHYKELCDLNIKWAVVEQSAIVERAANTNNLKFFKTIDEALQWLGKPDVIHCNGALQYVPDPVKVLNELVAIQAKRILWYRMVLSDNGIDKGMQYSRLADNGPGKVKWFGKGRIVEYEITIISEKIFKEAHEGYRLIKAGDGEYWYER